jgi:MFS family permease
MEKKESQKWMYALMPYNATIFFIGTFIPLFILKRGGNVVDIGLATAFYNLSLTIFSLIWGMVIDRIESRKILLVSGISLMTILILIILKAGNPTNIIMVYALLGISIAMINTPINILIIETSSKSSLNSSYNNFYWYSYIGGIIGQLGGAIWINFLGLENSIYFSILLSILTLGSFILLLKEPLITLERENILMNLKAFSYKLLQIPLFFIRIPRIKDFVSFFRSIKIFLERDFFIVMSTIILFFASANLFFTSYTPYLKNVGLFDSEIFLLSTYITFVNTFSSLLLRKMKEGEELDIAKKALYIRFFGFFLASTFSVFIQNRLNFYTTLISFTFIGIAYTLATIPLNVMLFKTLRPEKKGEEIGIFSSLNGITIFIVSFLSGLISKTLGYYVTFYLATILIFIPILLLETLRK